MRAGVACYILCHVAVDVCETVGCQPSRVRWSTPEERDLRTARGLVIASALCWLLGAIQLFLAMTILTVALRVATPDRELVSTGVLSLVVAVGYCAAGYGLATRRRFGGLVAVPLSALLGVFQLTNLTWLSSVGLGMNVGVIALVSLGWQRLSEENDRGGGSTHEEGGAAPPGDTPVS